MSGKVELGEAMRDKFYLEEGVAFCNHGSYGAVPKVRKHSKKDWRKENITLLLWLITGLVNSLQFGLSFQRRLSQAGFV